MNVVDSSAWMSYFAGDRNSTHFAQPIQTIDDLLVPSIALTEVFKSIFRQRGEEPALAAIAHMQQGRVIPLDADLAIEAATVGIEFGLPLADGIIYATTRRFNATLWTQDADFKDLESVRFYAKSQPT